MASVTRWGVYLCRLDPTVGSEIRKTRPCVVVSPDEMNAHLNTFIVAPLTTGGRAYASRIPCRFDGLPGFVVLDQVRTLDERRIVRKLGELLPDEGQRVSDALVRMFTA